MGRGKGRGRLPAIAPPRNDPRAHDRVIPAESDLTPGGIIRVLADGMLYDVRPVVLARSPYLGTAEGRWLRLEAFAGSGMPDDVAEMQQLARVIARDLPDYGDEHHTRTLRSIISQGSVVLRRVWRAVDSREVLRTAVIGSAGDTLAIFSNGHDESSAVVETAPGVAPQCASCFETLSVECIHTDLTGDIGGASDAAAALLYLMRLDRVSTRRRGASPSIRLDLAAGWRFDLMLDQQHYRGTAAHPAYAPGTYMLSLRLSVTPAAAARIERIEFEPEIFPLARLRKDPRDAGPRPTDTWTCEGRPRQTVEAHAPDCRCAELAQAIVATAHRLPVTAGD